MNNDSRDSIVQSNEIIDLLKNPKVIAFMNQHVGERAEHLALKFGNRVDFNLTKVTQLLQLYTKARNKIPLWVEYKCALDAKSYAQCSHASIAEFKASLFSGDCLIDMTAGLGVDAFYFSNSFKRVVALENNPSTHNFSKFNANQLGSKNIEFIEASCLDYTPKENCDYIYIDPDRRPNTDEQVKNVEAYSPNIFALQNNFLSWSKNVLIKLSPMTDLNFLEKELNHLKTIYVISHRNEVKEVLVHQSMEASNYQRVAVDIGIKDTSQFCSSRELEGPIKFEINAKFLIEPFRSIIKAGLSGTFASKHRLSHLHKKGHYFLSNQLIGDPMCRQFEILETLEVQWKSISKWLKSKKIKAINIAQRQFFEDVKQIRKRLKINEGGNDFLIFSTTHEGKSVCYYARPTSL